MEKLSKSYGESIHSVKLYLDDVEGIVGILREATNSIEIETDNFKLADITELQNIKEEYITKLHITGRNPYISIDFNPNRIWLYIANDVPVARGIFEKIKEVLSKRRRRFIWVLHSPIFHGLLGGVSVNVVYYGVISRYMSISIAGIALFCTTAILTWYGHRHNVNKYSLIVLKPKVASKSFISRNKDKIILAFISAIIGFIFAIIVKKLF